MSEIQLKQRVRVMGSNLRKASIESLSGFAVEQEPQVVPKATGFIEMNDCYIIRCDACGESFIVDKVGYTLVDGVLLQYNRTEKDVHFCAMCGAKRD